MLRSSSLLLLLNTLPAVIFPFSSSLSLKKPTPSPAKKAAPNAVASAEEKRLTDNLVYIDEVKVSKSYPSTVVIDCKEAVKAADIEYEGGYYVLSTSGRILEANNPMPTGGIPIITGFKFYTAQERIDKGEELTDEEIFAFRAAGAKLRSEDNYSDKIINDLMKELIEQDYENVKTIDITSRANIMLNIDNRLDIKLGSSADIGYKLSYFKAVMGKLADNYEGTLIYNGSEKSLIKKENLKKWDFIRT